jgi:hypothetical protein
MPNQNRTKIEDLNKDHKKKSKKLKSAGPVSPLNDEPDTVEIDEDKNPVLTVWGKEYDMDTVTVTVIILILWFFIWNSTGLIKLAQQDNFYLFILVIFPMYMILNTSTSGVHSGGVVYELNILLSVEQMIAILFGTVVLFVLFIKNLPISPEWMVTMYTIGIIMIVLLCTASLWVNVVTSGRAFRMVRKGKQQIYNMCLILFVTMGTLFFKIQKKST